MPREASSAMDKQRKQETASHEHHATRMHHKPCSEKPANKQEKQRTANDERARTMRMYKQQRQQQRQSPRSASRPRSGHNEASEITQAKRAQFVEQIAKLWIAIHKTAIKIRTQARSTSLLRQNSDW